MAVVLLCRHGETEANAAGILQGQSDSLLTELGRSQALLLGSAVARRLAASGGLPPCPFIYSSDLSRAVDTAAAVVAACSGHIELKLQQDARLRERRLGPFQGRTQDDCQACYPKTWGDFLREGEAFLREPPQPKEAGADANGGIESVSDMRTRAVAVLNEIASAHPQQTTVVVSHGGLVNMAISTLTAPKGAIPHIGNCSISVLRREANGTWVADVIGDSDHVQRGLRDESNVDAPAVR